jgi:hypothetical protein
MTNRENAGALTGAVTSCRGSLVGYESIDCTPRAMAHALEVLFDRTTEAAIKDLWAQLEMAGVPSLASRPHRRHRP